MQIRLLPRRLIGQTIRGIRNRVGMSQAEFAKALGVENGSVVARWERGQAQPEYGTLAKIATMGVVDVLVFHEAEDKGTSPQITPGEATELREIITRMEALLSDAKAIVERATNRTAVDVLEAAAGSRPVVTATAETRPQARPRTASTARRTTAAETPRTPSRTASAARRTPAAETTRTPPRPRTRKTEGAAAPS